MKGGCYCGALRDEVTGEPVLQGECLCRECQYISGGGPNFFLIVPNDAFRITQGDVAAFKRTDIEPARTRQFCPTCGTHITTLLPDRPVTVVKVGTLDDPAGDYGGPKLAIFGKDRQPFHVVADDVPCFEERPPA